MNREKLETFFRSAVPTLFLQAREGCLISGKQDGTRHAVFRTQSTSASHLAKRWCCGGGERRKVWGVKWRGLLWNFPGHIICGAGGEKLFFPIFRSQTCGKRIFKLLPTRVEPSPSQFRSFLSALPPPLLILPTIFFRFLRHPFSLTPVSSLPTPSKASIDFAHRLKRLWWPCVSFVIFSWVAG